MNQERIKGAIRNRSPRFFKLLKKTKSVAVTTTDMLRLRKHRLEDSLDAFFSTKKAA